jgi:endonuclease YncB( thermonuclease family)
VRWTDGDTFRFVGGPHGGESARLEGYNTLESYGPVHRWGRWTPAELLANARAATAIARAGRWTCTTRGDRDGYGRVLVSCPGAGAELVRTGHAMVFAVDAPADPALLELQRRAQRERVGMWARGVPAVIVSSVHSTAERPGRAYDRLVDTRTGAARRVPHDRAYRTCEEVCAGPGDAGSCMLYVPFERRYRGRPACLR